MGLLIFFVLSMLSVFTMQTEEPPSVICVYNGANKLDIYAYHIKLADIPERCNVILYGGYYFNQDSIKSDLTDIAMLKSAGKTVYIMYMCPPTDDWDKIISSKDPSVLEKFVAPMIKCLKETQIDGVVLDALGLQDGTTVDYATKMNTFINIIKKTVPKIKIGLGVESGNSDQYSNKTLFDFTVSNDNVDFYAFDLWIYNCQPNTTATGGRLPITSTDSKVVTLEKICNAISSSPIDQNKIVAGLLVYTTMLPCSDLPRTYRDYCRRQKGEVWCADSIQIQYDRVKYLKKRKFKGIMIYYMDLDDYDNSCGCGNFPVAKTSLDAWEDKPITCCDNLS